MSPVYKMVENGRLTVDQKVKVILFYAETKTVVATQRRFARGCQAKCGHMNMFFIRNNFSVCED